MKEIFAEIVLRCEVKPDEDIKAFTSKRIVKMHIQAGSFLKARGIVQKFSMSETTQEKSLQKHLKSGCFEKVMHIIQLFQVLR